MDDYTATETESPIIDQAKEQGQQVFAQGQKVAADLAGKAVSQAKASIGTQKDALAQTVGGVADALQHTSDHLRDNGSGAIAEYATTAADHIKEASQFLTDRNIDELIVEANSFARAKPVIFLSVALVIGIVAARFLKSTEKEATDSNGTGVYSNGAGYTGVGQSYGDQPAY